MKKPEDIDQAELARLRDHLLENPWAERETDVEIHKVFHNEPISFRDGDYHCKHWCHFEDFLFNEDGTIEDVSFRYAKWSKVPRYTSDFGALEYFIGNAVWRRLSLRDTTIYPTDKIEYQEGGWQAELIDSEGRIKGSSPVTQTFAAAILLAVIDDVTKNRIWVPANGREDESGLEDAEEGGWFEALPTKESEDRARRVACRKELIDSVPGSPEAVFRVIQSALIRSDVEDRLLLIWQDQLKSRLPKGWELEWDLERYKRGRGFWIRFPGDRRQAFRLQFRFDLDVPDYGITGTEDMLPPGSVAEADHVFGRRRSGDDCWLWKRWLCEFGRDWRDNEDFWVAMSSGRLADWIIEIAVYIHDAIGRGAPFENLQPPEFMDNSKGAAPTVHWQLPPH